MAEIKVLRKFHDPLLVQGVNFMGWARFEQMLHDHGTLKNDEEVHEIHVDTTGMNIHIQKKSDPWK